MKKITVVLLLILFSFFSCKQKESKSEINSSPATAAISDIDAQKYSGEWTWEENSDNSTFSINLRTNSSGEIEGFYCAVARNGNKIDCSSEKESNIKIIKKQKNGYLASFDSFFMAKGGEAEISIVNNKLHWKVIKEPSGEFYCPKEAYLAKKEIEKELNNSLLKELNITSKNYKGSDITLKTYKQIIDTYGCGDLSVSGIVLGEVESYKIFIVEDQCGDFPFKDLISVKNGKIVGRLLIDSSSIDVEKFESQKIKDETNISFDIRDLKNIQLIKINSINNKVKNSNTTTYYMDSQGIFKRKE